MPTHVYANNNEIASKASDGKSIAAFPDVCFSPPAPPAGPLPLPYPNTGECTNTDKGTSKVFIKDKMAGMEGDSYFSKSMGDEAATQNFNKGMITSALQGKCYFGLWSMDVQMEGKGVPRHLDMVTHNHGSQSGAVNNNNTSTTTPPQGKNGVVLRAVQIPKKYFIRCVGFFESITHQIDVNLSTKVAVSGGMITLYISNVGVNNSLSSIEIGISNLSFSKKEGAICSAVYVFNGSKENFSRITLMKDYLFINFDSANSLTVFFPVIFLGIEYNSAYNSSAPKIGGAFVDVCGASTAEVWKEHSSSVVNKYSVDIVGTVYGGDTNDIVLTDNELVKKIKKLGVQYILACYAKYKYALRDVCIFGVRSKSKDATNRYVDAIGCIFKSGTEYRFIVYNATTLASTFTFLRPSNGVRLNATPILCRGQYFYKIGRHHGRVKALVPVGGLMTYRDTTRDIAIDYINGGVEYGNSLNIHTTETGSDDKLMLSAKEDRFKYNPYITGIGEKENAKPYSSGCQVIQNPKDYIKLFNICCEFMLGNCKKIEKHSQANIGMCTCEDKIIVNKEKVNPCYISYTLFYEEEIIIEHEVCALRELQGFKEA